MKLRYFLPFTYRESRFSSITFVEPAELAIMWSAKSACTTVITWAFRHNGLLEEALAYSHWIHRYRLRQYQKSSRYRTRLRQLRHRRGPVIKVARNPFERAVSSFVHAYRHGYEDAALAPRLSRPLDRLHRFSFREFVHYLETIDLSICNPHHRTQTTLVERHILFGLKPTRIIRIEDGLSRALGEVERQFGLPATDFSDPVFRSGHHTSRAGSGEFAADRSDLWERDLPPAGAFYDDDLIVRVARLYAEDFRRYGYDPKLLA